MPDTTIRHAIKPVAPKTVSNEEKRKLELIQLETRYKSSYKCIRDTENETAVRLAIVPSDPDFPYEISSLQVQISIPKSYPQDCCTVQVLNSDIPKGFAINLEKGYIERVKSTTAHQTLVRQMNWLDRNMEALLQQSPAPTVSFVTNSSNNRSNNDLHDTAARDVQQQQQQNKQFIDVTSAPISNHSIFSSSPSSSSKTVITNSKVNAIDASPSHLVNKKPDNAVNKPTDTTTKKSKETAEEIKQEETEHNYSAEEIAKSEKKRIHEFKQLQTRFCDSFKIARSLPKELVATLTLKINDTEFTQEQLVGGKELFVKYHVPVLYPLSPCTIEIDNKNMDTTRASWVSSGFNEHVAKNTDYTLFENLNWLNRNLDLLLTTPPAQKTEEQLEAEHISASQHNDIRPPVKQKRNLSVNAVEFTPRQQEKKKAVSLFDESDNIKKNRVIIVNDPNLIISQSEQAEEEEIEVELGDQEGLLATDGNEGSQSVLNGVSPQPTIRKGTEVRLIDPKLENVSLFRCTILHIMVKCARCKDTMEVENIKPDQEEKQDPASSSSSGDKKNQPKVERWMTCPTCSSVMGIKFIGELVHQGAMSLGLLQLAGCTAYDTLSSHYIGTCGSCMTDMASPVRLSPNDPPHTHNCFSCHAKMVFSLGDYRFIKIGEGGERLIASSDQLLKLKKKNNKREEQLIVGTPLPDNGTCSHYRKSKRWFRFSCCHKLYPCDNCHDKKEDHNSELAKRHVCGMCSREQPTSGGRPCVCGYDFEAASQKNAFWEGGKGIRNRTTMSRKDPHKHKGVGKTSSKKQERVGMAGKERHQSEDA